MDDCKENDCIIINDFPIPPSDNALKKPVQRYAKGGHQKVLSFVDTPEYLAYKNEINFFCHRFSSFLKESQELMQSWLDGGSALGIEIDYKLCHSTIFTKKDTVKKWDVANRIKGLMDGLTRVTGIDDRNYFKVTSTKQTQLDGLKEHASLRIYPIEIRNPSGEGLVTVKNQ